MRKALFLLVGAIAVFSFCAGGDENDWPAWDIVVIAHRGLASGYPENTLAAFANAIDLGADVIETDLRETRDGVIVLLHEDSVENTTDGAGFVSDYAFAELRELDAGRHAGPQFAGEPIPTLEEALDLVIPRGVKLLLDIKSSSEIDCEGVVRLIEQRGAVLDVIIGVRSIEDAQLFRTLNPNLRQLGFLPSATDIEEFVAAGVDIVRLWARWIHTYPPFVGRVHDLSKPVWVTSGLAGREEHEELIRLGANGFITDLPDVLIELLIEHQSQTE